MLSKELLREFIWKLPQIMDIDKKTGPCYTCLKRLNHHF